jgi:type III secretion system YscQ/HrcQ family protein
MASAQTWLKRITPQIFESLSLSEQGTLPPFALEDFQQTLRESLNLENLSISIEKMDFIDGDHFFDHLSNKTISIPLTLHPLDGLCHFVMGSKDVGTLIQNMQKEEEALSLENDSMIKGLYTYFITEAIDAIHLLENYLDLSLKITEGTITDLSAFAIDISIKINDHNLPARLLVTKKLYKAIHAHYKFIPPTLDNLEDMPHVSVPMTINTGSISLTQTELMGLEEGDFIVLHNTFYKPNEKKGSFQMMIGNHPILQVKTQKDGIKILDYLYFFNEETMDENEITDHIDQELPTGNPLESPEDQLAGENFDDDESFGDENFDEDLNDDLNANLDSDLDSDLDSEMDQEAEARETEMLSPEKTNLSEVSLTVNLEIARFALSLEQLKQITPGFKLPVNINPLHVNLVVSGKSIGTGEIIQIGDTTGVKVTKLNK